LSDNSRPRTLARWRRWYARTLRSLDGLTQDDIIASWLLRVRPNVWALAWEPTPIDQTRWPGQYVHDAAGWWGPEDLAARQPAGLAIAGGSSLPPIASGHPGFAFGRPISQVVPCGAVIGSWRLDRAWKHRGTLGPFATENLRYVRAMLRFDVAHVSRRKDIEPLPDAADWPDDPALWTGKRWRSGVQPAPLARVLLLWGLIDDGTPARAAVSLWLGWEIELDGPATKSEVVREAAAMLGRANTDDRVLLHEFEASELGGARRYWRALGIGR
jgi:hypothetical protein